MADYNPEAIERGMGTLRDFYNWRESNPRAWAWAEQFVLDAIAAGQHVGGQTIVEAIRNHDFADRRGKPTRTNNNYSPIFARALLQAHPEIQDRIELRASVFDAIMGVAAHE